MKPLLRTKAAGNPMRLALIAPGFSRDSADWAIPALQHFTTQVASRLDLTLFSLRYPQSGTYTWERFQHLAVGGGNRSGWRSALIVSGALRNLIARHRQKPFDLVHAFWADEPGLVATLAGRWLRRPVVVTLGGGELIYLKDIGYGTAGSLIRRQMVRLALSGAAAIVAGSRYQRDQARHKGAPTGRLHRLPLGVDIKQFTPGPEPKRHAPTLVQAASLVPVKGQELLLETLALVKKRWPGFHLRLAGRGPRRAELKAMAAALGLDENVDWLDSLPHPRMAGFYRPASVYVQTSRHESQGMSVLEAMACGIPPVGTPVGILPEVSPVPTASSAAGLAENLSLLLSDPDGLAQARLTARKAVELEYTLESSVSRYLCLYRRLLSGGGEEELVEARVRAEETGHG